MLKDGFFTINEVVDSGESKVFRVELNASHPIFQAHFAGNPVMPGACIAQMVKELAEDCFSASFFIGAIRNMKFLKVINPLENPEVSVQMTCTAREDNSVFVSTLISDRKDIFSKAILVLNPCKS
jgi:3-hydroxyacyl-[acyl-carrier-protein] dehydratase